MLPLIVLRRFDLVLPENKQKVLDEKKRLEDNGITGPALEKALPSIAATGRKQELFNVNGFTFEKLLGDAPTSCRAEPSRAEPIQAASVLRAD
jgi:type I restriction enzyme M protein